MQITRKQASAVYAGVQYIFLKLQVKVKIEKQNCAAHQHQPSVNLYLCPMHTAQWSVNDGKPQ